MKTLLLNLPHCSRIQRRYMCSSLAPNYLFPPIELLSIGGIVKYWKNDEVELKDAIAESLPEEEVATYIRQYKPDIIVTLSGFESVEYDMLCIKRLKQKFPKIKFILFGHYPTEFPQELLLASTADFILRGEPDLIFSSLYDAIKNNGIFEIEGVAYKTSDGGFSIAPQCRRVPDPNSLPTPVFELLKNDLYNEFFLPKPFGLLQTERGCPYQCNYCVKSYGTKLTALKPQKVIEQILYLKQVHNIKSLRFIDDTFTAIPERVIEICKLILQYEIDIQWTCLSRADTINEEMLMWMSDAGCKRIYFGIETGSKKINALLNKNIDRPSAVRNLLLCKKYNIETAGFFLMGHPLETSDDVTASIQIANEAGLNYAVVGQLIPYPGTSLFQQYKDQIDFSIFPYKNSFKDKAIDARYKKSEARFYLAFYFNFGYIRRNIFMFVSKFKEHLSIFKVLFKGLSDVQYKQFPGFNTIANAAKK